MKLVYFSLAFVLGIYIGSHYSLPPAVAAPIIAAAVFTATVGRKSRPLMLGGACIALLMCGIIRFGALPDGDGLQGYIGREDVQVTGVVSEEPEPSDSSVKLIVSAREVDGEEASGTFLVRTSRYPSYQYGDLLTLAGELEQPPDDLDGFDYRAYLQRQGIYTTMYYPDVELIEGGQGSQPQQAIYGFRHRMGEALEESLSEPQGSLARAVLLGLRHDIPQSLYEDFQRSGTAHLLAISGLHMAIVAGIVLGLAARLFGRHRPTYFIVTMLVLWSYAVMAGMSPSVARAAIMVSVFLVGIYAGRQGSGLTAVAFAAAAMAAVDPQVLWQVSFQLSFAAVLGLILLTPAFKRWLEGVRVGKLYLPGIAADSFAYSAGAILMTLPLVAYHFGYVSLVGLPATFLAALVLPHVIVLSAVVGIIGIASVPVAQVVGWVDWLFLKYTTAVVQGFAALGYASMTIGGFNAAFVWLYYAVVGAVIWLGIKRRILFDQLSGVLSARGGFGRDFDRPAGSRVRWVILSLSVTAVLLWVAVIITPDGGRLSVSFLDVGQGDSILVTAPGGGRMLVDGGPSPEKVCAGLGDALPFWEHTIDIVVLTHPHDDHVSGLVEVCRRYDVDGVLYSEDIQCDSDAYAEWLDVIDERDIPCTGARAGQVINLGNEAIVEVLHPQGEPLEGTESDEDNNGVVLRVEMGDVSFLLTGDLYGDGELWLACHSDALDSTVLKVSHHGSSTSTCPEFLAAVDPQAAVICVGEDNRFGHPTDEVMARLTERVGEDNIYLTSDGTVTFTTDGERLWVETEQ
jgi:competence protein ComEC